MIELFKTPNNYYLFDACKSEAIPISKSTFETIRYLLQKNDAPEPMIPTELEELKAQGYLLSESPVLKVRHPYTDYLKDLLDRKLSKLTIQLTQDCNFRCKYCVYSHEHSMRQRSHSKKSIPLETAKKAIDFLRAHSIDSPSVNVGFYGGEPLLEFPMMKELVQYSIDCFAGKDLTFNITTNGTLLSDEVIYFCEENEVSLMISLDGPKEINDLNRVFINGKGTFDAVIERVNRVREIAPGYAEKLQISMVMDPTNDFDCINEICMDDSALKRLSIQPSIVEREYGDERTYASIQYIWKIEYQRFLAILAYYGRFPKDNVSPIAENWLTRVLYDSSLIENKGMLRSEDAPSGPCIPGQLRLFVNADGLFFPCERVSEKSPAMCIGSIDSGFNIEKAYRILNVGSLTEAECRNCWCFRLCTLCAKKADDNSEELSERVKKSYCPEIRIGAYSTVQQYLLFKEIPVYYPNHVRANWENIL